MENIRKAGTVYILSDLRKKWGSLIRACSKIRSNKVSNFFIINQNRLDYLLLCVIFLGPVCLHYLCMRVRTYDVHHDTQIACPVLVAWL